jgi:hypothetical protein
MECRDVRELLDSYLGQELLVETNHDVLRHLSGCADCTAELDARTRIRRGLKRAFDGAADLRMRPDFAGELAARLQGIPIPARAEPRQRGRFYGWLALAASLVAIAAAGIYVLRSGQGSVSRIAQQAAGDHQNCAVTFRLDEAPIRLAEAAAKYDPAFARMETMPPNEVTTAAGVLRAVERHSCVFDARRFGHVVFKLDEHLVSVLMTADASAKADGGSGAPAWLPSYDGLSIASVPLAGHRVFIVSDLPEASFRPVAEALAGTATQLAALFRNIPAAPGD